MFENLLQLVKENAGDAIVNNIAIPNEHNDAAIQTTASGIMDHLKGLTANGGVEKVMEMFNGGDVQNNQEVNNMSSNIAGDLMSKFGLNSEMANSAIKNLIPVVMSQLVSKTNDPKDSSFNLDGIIGSLSGGKSGGIGGLLGGLKGLFGK